MRLGITATRRGLTYRQQWQVDLFINSPDVAEIHHGDCIGGDEEAHLLALAAGKPVRVHPPVDERYRAWCQQLGGDVQWMEPHPYLERNHNIVDATDVLVAAPDGPERMRSGTWATVRYARKIGRPVAVIEPGHTLFHGDWTRFRVGVKAEITNQR